jgi:hypothetical protein
VGDDLARVLEYWRAAIAEGTLLLAFGGTRENFARVDFEPRVFIDDPKLRTRDHQREYQSMTAFYRTVTQWLNSSGRAFEFIYFTEYDHLPLIPDLNERQIERLESEEADVLAFNLLRIDGTCHPHYLYHLANPRLRDWLTQISVREEKEVVFAMLGTGSFWRREAFEAIGNSVEPFPFYNELYVPTLAHHLGFRLRDWGEQNHFVRNLGDYADRMEEWRAQGAWTIHPVKRLPSRRPALGHA